MPLNFYIQNFWAIVLSFAFWFWIIRGLVRRHRNHLKKHPKLVSSPAANRNRKKCEKSRLEAMKEIDYIMLEGQEHGQFYSISSLNTALGVLFPDNTPSAIPYGPREVEITLNNSNSHGSRSYLVTIINSGFGREVAIDNGIVTKAEDLVNYLGKEIR